MLPVCQVSINRSVPKPNGSAKLLSCLLEASAGRRCSVCTAEATCLPTSVAANVQEHTCQELAAHNDSSGWMSCSSAYQQPVDPAPPQTELMQQLCCYWVLHCPRLCQCLAAPRDLPARGALTALPQVRPQCCDWQTHCELHIGAVAPHCLKVTQQPRCLGHQAPGGSLLLPDQNPCQPHQQHLAAAENQACQAHWRCCQQHLAAAGQQAGHLKLAGVSHQHELCSCLTLAAAQPADLAHATGAHLSLPAMLMGQVPGSAAGRPAGHCPTSRSARLLS